MIFRYAVSSILSAENEIEWRKTCLPNRQAQTPQHVSVAECPDECRDVSKQQGVEDNLLVTHELI